MFQLREMVNRYHRPQYSYLHLIQMAISSTPEKQMTLKQIYRWIEDNFLYYSYTPNQGWKVNGLGFSDEAFKKVKLLTL